MIANSKKFYLIILDKKFQTFDLFQTFKDPGTEKIMIHH